jgi:hypothetical protein
MLIASARDTSPVSGLTHNHYKYPARFSPKFVRTAITAFTEPGDLVFDPFVGGGTTLVEALASQRNAVGVDISSLAIFVSEAKTLLLDGAELDSLSRWVTRLPEAINIHKATLHSAEYEERGYYRNINTREFWRLRKAIEQALASALRLQSPKAQVLARCIILRAAQWTLDTRKDPLPVREFRRILVETALSMIAGAAEFNLLASGDGSRPPPNVTCINATAAGIEDTDRLTDMKCPRLVLTSPPYPGVHVLYHRWQVNGGRETPAPFWIANKLDGSGLSYYTLGDRKHPELTTYFDNLREVLCSAVKLSSTDTVFVQVVAFNSPDWQLPRYLEIAEEAGLTELFIPNTGSRDHRLWRNVPNRRWYADQRGSTNSSREVVLFHRPSRSHVSRTLQPNRTNPRPLY